MLKIAIPFTKPVKAVPFLLELVLFAIKYDKFNFLIFVQK